MATTYNKRLDAAHERDTTRYRVRQLWDSMRVPRARRTRGVVAQATSRVGQSMTSSSVEVSVRCVRKTGTNGSSPASHRQTHRALRKMRASAVWNQSKAPVQKTACGVGHTVRELRDVRAERSRLPYRTTTWGEHGGSSRLRMGCSGAGRGKVGSRSRTDFGRRDQPTTREVGATWRKSGASQSSRAIHECD